MEKVTDCPLLPIEFLYCDIDVQHFIFLFSNAIKISLYCNLLHFAVCIFPYRKLFFQIGCKQVETTLLQSQAQGLPTLYWSACVEGYHNNMLDTLDRGKLVWGNQLRTVHVTLTS